MFVPPDFYEVPHSHAPSEKQIPWLVRAWVYLSVCAACAAAAGVITFRLIA